MSSTPTISTTEFIKKYIEDPFGIIIAGNDQSKLENVINKFTKHSVMFIFILISGIILFYSIRNPDTIGTNRMYTVILISMLPIIAGFYMSNNNLMYDISDTTQILYIGGGLLLIGLVIYFYSYIQSYASKMMTNYTAFALLILIVLFGLSMVYQIAESYLLRFHGLTGLFIKIIFFIPCLLLELLKFVMDDYYNTPNAVFIMLIAGIVTILLYIYIPKLKRAALTDSKTVVVKEPVYFVKQVRVRDMVEDASGVRRSQFCVRSVKPGTDICTNAKDNFCINGWIYVTPQNGSNENVSANLFEYALFPQYKRPKNVQRTDATLYLPSCRYNKLTKKLEIRCGYATPDSPLAPTEFDIRHQRWTNIACNFYEGVCDVFIDGILAGSVKINTDNITKYRNEFLEANKKNKFSGDKTRMSDKDALLREEAVMTLGNEDGIHGAICNLQFHYLPMSELQITNNYTIYSSLNPPYLAAP